MLNESICITDSNLEFPGPKIVYVNDRLCELTGYKKEELIGKTPRIFQGPKSNHEAHKALKKILPKGHLFKDITTNYRKDGTEFDVIWNIMSIFADNKIVAYLSVQTTTNPLEDELQKIKKLNEEILKNLDKYLGVDPR